MNAAISIAAFIVRMRPPTHTLIEQAAAMEEQYDITEAPLSAGGMARLHLGSFALEYNFTPQYFKQIHRDFKKLESQVNRKRGLKSLRNAADVFSLKSHEQDHLNRLVGTSFGYLLDVVRSRWVMATAKLVGKRLTESDGDVLPLGRIAPSRFETTAEIIADLESRSGSDGQALICQGLSDCLHALLDDVMGPMLVSALWGLTSGKPEKIRYLLDDADTPHRSGFSLVKANGQRDPLKARHLLELFGWREQGNALNALGYDLKDVEKLFFDGSSEYELAFEVWRTIIPQANELVTAKGESELIWWEKSFPFELFVCADLALWPPFEPPGRISSGFRWYDINPARRFVTILVAFRELGLKIAVQRDDELNERLLEIQSKLCERLKWPTPHALARQWLDFLSGEQVKNATPWHELEPESSLRVASAVSILKVRLERPADVVLNHLAVEEYGGRSAPLWIFQLPNKRKKFSSLSEPFHDFILQTLLYEGTAHLYTGTRPIMQCLDEPWLAESGAKYVAKKYAEFADWPTEMRIRFEGECRAYFLKAFKSAVSARSDQSR